MTKFIAKFTLLTLLALGFAACGKSNPGLSLGALGVNGPGIDGSVPTGTKRVYTLLNINAGQNYTLRTEIATLGTDTTPDGTLTVSIYESEAAFKSDPTTSVTTLAPLDPQTNFPYVYEANFQAPSSGNYVAVISGTSLTNSTTQFFYDLRLMSADPAAVPSVLTSFATTSVPASQTVAINPGYIQVYNGNTITSSGTYSINLKTTVTATVAYPQLFVYKDSTLKTESLLYSSVTNSINFIVTDFNFTTSPTSTPRPTDPNNNLASGVTITGVPFTSGTTTGNPFIVVKGTSAVTYTLTVGQ